LAETGILPVQLGAQLATLSLLESTWNLSDDTLQRQRLVKEWFPPTYEPMEANYSSMDSVARLGRSMLQEHKISLTKEFLNPLRQKYEPLLPILRFKHVMVNGVEFTKAELRERRSRYRYPMYLKVDKILVAQLRIRLRLKVSKLADDQFYHKQSSTRHCPHCCASKQDAEHMIMECSELENVRKTAFQSLRNIGIEDPKFHHFLGHVTDVAEDKQNRVLHITGQFLHAVEKQGYDF
jgi:hypothetical protein